MAGETSGTTTASNGTATVAPDYVDGNSALFQRRRELQQQLAERDRELVVLYQRLDADEKRIQREPRR